MPFGLAMVLRRHAGLAKLGRHEGQHGVGLIMSGVGAQVLALVNIDRLHPARIDLLAPVEKRRLPPHEVGDGVEGILLVVGEGF